MRMVRSVRNFWLEHPSIDLLLALIIIGSQVLLVVVLEMGDVLGWASNERRSMVYMSTAATAALVSAFGALTTAQARTATGRRASAIKRRDTSRALRRSLRNALTLPLLIAGVAIVALALDTTESDAGGVRFVFGFAFTLGVLVVARLATLFIALDAIDELDQDEDTGPPLVAPVGLPEPMAASPAPRTRRPRVSA